MSPSEQLAMKIAAATAALEFVENGMLLGLGTGSTAEEFVKMLAAKLSTGELRKIQAICTSRRTEALAVSAGIPLLDQRDLTRINLAVDGADEIDHQLRLIKGLGGALLREKIVEQTADRFVVIADESKLVDRLGRGKLPVEVVRFGLASTLLRVASLTDRAELRMKDGTPFETDEGHLIIDVGVPVLIDVAELHRQLLEISGVVETGFFGTEATDAVIASAAGVRVLHRPC